MKYLLLFLLLPLFAYPQDTIKNIQIDAKLHINIRNAKIDTVFDYYVSIGSKIIIREFITINLKGSYERDNGIIYLAHSEIASCKYGQSGYIYDTEKDVKLFYASIYYPFLKVFKTGYDFSCSQTSKHSIYFSVTWEFINAEIAFFENIRRIKYVLNPILKKWDKLSLKANIEGLYIADKFKWQNGLSLNYTII